MEDVRKRLDTESNGDSNPAKEMPFAEVQGHNLLQELRVHQIELEMQNEELRKTQRELEQLHQKYADLYDFAPVGYLTIDAKGLISQANLTCSGMLGVQRDQLIRLSLANFIAKEDQDIYYRYRRKVFKTRTPQSCEIGMRSKGGVRFHTQISCTPVLDDMGQVVEVRVAIADISSLKRAEEQIRASLEEKEILLQELYHRTKNNLQAIRSMFRLQALCLKDERSKEIFREMDNRISAMALVHQKLYQARNLSIVNLREYIHDLVALLMKSYEVSPDRVAFILEVEDIPASIDLAIPCGLLINELISNAFKHAFPEGRKGNVAIRLSKALNGDLHLCVADNGVGVPEGFDPGSQDTLGLRTIVSLAEYQLQGQVVFETSKGVTCQIRFNDRRPNHARVGNA